MNRKRRAAALLTAVLCLCQTGCYDRRELNTLGFVVGVGIDAAEDQENLDLTLQLANVSGSEGGKGGGKTSKESEDTGTAFLNVTDTGPTVNTVLRDMEHHLSRRIYMPHMQILVFGEDLAKNGVRDSLDFFARAKEPRMTLYMLVAKGKAADVLDVKPQLEQYTSSALMQLVGDQDATSDTPMVSQFEFVREIMKKSTAALLPMVEITENNGAETLRVGGSAIFKDTVMVGELSREETRGVLWVTGKVKGGILNVELEGAKAAMEIWAATGSMRYEEGPNGENIFRIKVGVTVSMGDQTGTINLAAPENSNQLLELCRQKISEEVYSALEKSRELEADVFGFGETISRYAPKRWKQIKDNWDEEYQQANVELTVEIRGSGTGRIIRPLDNILD